MVVHASTCDGPAVPSGACSSSQEMAYSKRDRLTCRGVRRALSALSPRMVSAAGQQDVRAGGQAGAFAVTSFETISWGVRTDPRVLIEKSRCYSGTEKTYSALESVLPFLSSARLQAPGWV